MNKAHVLQIPFIPITILLEKKNQPVTVAYVAIERVVFVGRWHVVVKNYFRTLCYLNRTKNKLLENTWDDKLFYLLL